MEAGLRAWESDYQSGFPAETQRKPDSVLSGLSFRRPRRLPVVVPVDHRPDHPPVLRHDQVDVQRREGDEQPHDRGVPDADLHRVAEDREHEGEHPRQEVGVKGEPKEDLEDGDREQQEVAVLLQNVVLLDWPASRG